MIETVPKTLPYDAKNCKHTQNFGISLTIHKHHPCSKCNAIVEFLKMAIKKCWRNEKLMNFKLIW